MFPIANIPIAKLPIAKISIAEIPIGKAPIGKALIGKALIGKALIGKIPARLGRAALLSLLVIVAGVAQAAAHASLLRSSPADGSRMAEAPGTVTLTFNEPVAPLRFRLVTADAAGLELNGVQAHDQTIVVTLPALADGSHALNWRVVSADGHPVGGAIVFATGAATATGIGAGSGTSSATPAILAGLIWAARLALYLGLFFGVGGQFFAAWITPGEPLPAVARRAGTACLATGLAAAVAGLGLQGLDGLAGELSQAFEPRVWRSALATSYAATLALAALALLLALASASLRRPAARRAGTAASLVSVGLALALSGHAGTAEPRWLTRPAVAIHAMAVTFWLGSLPPLAAAMAGQSAAAPAALLRFSRAIRLPLLALVASGIILAFVQLGQADALVATAYGLVLDGKLLLLAMLLALAALNRYRLAPRAAAGGLAGRQALVRSIVAETILAFAILAMVSLWRFTPPPRAGAAPAAAAALHMHIHGQRAMADLELADLGLAAGGTGPVAVSLSLLDAAFAALPATEVTVTFANPGAGIEPIRRQAVRVDAAAWRVDGVILPARGQWMARIDILVSDFDRITLEQGFHLPP